MVKHQREEDGLRALARIFTGSKSESKRKRWSLGRSSRMSSFSSEPELRETLKPSPSFKERRNLRRWARAILSVSPIYSLGLAAAYCSVAGSQLASTVVNACVLITMYAL